MLIQHNNVNKYSGVYMNCILYVRNDYAELPFSIKQKIEPIGQARSHTQHARPCLLVGHFDWITNVKILFCSQFKAVKGPVLKQGC